MMARCLGANLGLRSVEMRCFGFVVVVVCPSSIQVIDRQTWIRGRRSLLLDGFPGRGMLGRWCLRLQR